MNTHLETILLDSRQYTPIYFVEAPSIEQPASIVASQSDERPVSAKLKEFYENSGKLEDNLNIQQNNKQQPNLVNNVGNGLKLANFVLAQSQNKTNTIKINATTTKNVVFNPVFITNSNNSLVHSSKTAVCSKIIKPILRQGHQKSKTSQVLPKLKPKENNTKPIKSVQLIKLGETYHSLNELSDEQMKIVNHAINIYNNPKIMAKDQKYDPATSTKVVYKVVPPKDISVIGTNKAIVKSKKVESKRNTIKKQDKKEYKKNLKEDDPTLVQNEIFNSLYSLQRHYESDPTHAPGKCHSNLFQCLLAIIKTSCKQDKASIFIQQLQQLIDTIKSLIPCLLRTDGLSKGEPSTINEDIGRVLGLDPGKYIFNLDALDCVKDKDGHCLHSQPLNHTNQSTQVANNNNDNITSPLIDNCAQINMNKKWTTVGKRIEQGGKPRLYTNNKKIKLTAQSELPTQLKDEDIAAFFSNTQKTDIHINQNKSDKVAKKTDGEMEQDINIENFKKPPHIKFHSTHFDIRSSPIKPTTKPTHFTRFQINPDKILKFNIQEIKPLISQENGIMAGNQENNIMETDIPEQNNTIMENITSCDNLNEIGFDTTKDWPMKYVQSETHSAETLLNESTDFLKSNNLLQSDLNHINDTHKPLENIATDSQMASNNSLLSQVSELNFFDSLGNTCLSFPDDSARNSSVNDFQLDLLFSS
ncbi:unnamed protein product [Leptidea sinapis]|uniref:Uncharacterized protein n=1 Tax=Leptidea sinapis TaxID=189913 RepID=A0A5E4QMU0_9NEOP|nr:unnamed protein product [Leptidea sinapis]